MISIDKDIEYPLIIEIPKSYWTFSYSNEYSFDENKND
jgi:hypothetical protein